MANAIVKVVDGQAVVRFSGPETIATMLTEAQTALLQAQAAALAAEGYAEDAGDAAEVVGSKLDKDGANAPADTDELLVNLNAEVRLGGVHNSRVRASALIDDTARLQAELDAGYDKIRLPAGTIWVGFLVGRSNVSLVGQGKGKTIIKRLPGSTQTNLIRFSDVHGFRVEGLTLDGNAADNTVAASNMAVQSGCYDFQLVDVEAVDALVVGGSYGSGITVQDTTDHIHGTSSQMLRCEAHNCGTFGLDAYRVQNFAIKDCRASGNPNGGIYLGDYTLPVPTSPTNINVEISGNHAWGNGIGIGMFGFRSGVSALGDIASQDRFVSRNVRVLNNTVYENTLYGLACQLDASVIAGNTISRNGSTDSNGGALMNCRRTAFTTNTITSNYYYGLDAGGSRDCVITANILALTGTYDAGSGAANQCIALNLGGTIGCQVEGNQFAENGGTGASGGAYSIFASRYDGSSLSNWLLWGGRDLTIRNNGFTLTDADHVAIVLVNGFQSGVAVNDNTVFCDGVTPALAFDLSAEGGGFTQSGNRVRTTAETFAITTASATSMTIPDYGEDIGVSGTGTISTIRSRAMAYWTDKVRFIYMSAPGSGYTSPPTVSFTGGGGTGAQGQAVLGADGALYGVYVTVPGSGYTSAPTVVLTGGGGSGASAVATIGCANTDNRVVQFKFRAGATVTSGGNIYLRDGDFVADGSGLSTLSLRGEFGNWYEVCRAA